MMSESHRSHSKMTGGPPLRGFRGLKMGQLSMKISGCEELACILAAAALHSDEGKESSVTLPLLYGLYFRATKRVH